MGRLYIPDMSGALKGQTLSKAVQANFEGGIDGDTSGRDVLIGSVLVRIQDIPWVMNRLWRNIGDKYIRLE
jgi:hypothetical protein